MADTEKKVISSRLSGLKFMQRAAEKRKIEAIQKAPEEEPKEPEPAAPAPVGYCVVTYESSDPNMGVAIGRRVFGGAKPALSPIEPVNPLALAPAVDPPAPAASTKKAKANTVAKPTLEDIPQLKFFEEAEDFEVKTALLYRKDNCGIAIPQPAGAKGKNQQAAQAQAQAQAQPPSSSGQPPLSLRQMQQLRNVGTPGVGDAGRKRKPESGPKDNAFAALRPVKR